MVLAIWQATIVDDAGNVLPAAQIEVRSETSGTPLATIYQDRDGDTALGNPFNANAAPFASDGFVYFYAANGAYKITATSGSFSRTWRYVAVGLAAEKGSAEPGVSMLFDSATAAADPGAGEFRFNNADPASATAIYINSADADGNDLAAWIESFDDGGDATERGMLSIRSADNEATVIARVTGNVVVDGSPVGYYALAITSLVASQASSFTAGARYGITFVRSGVDGADGADGADGEIVGPGSGNVAAGQFAIFSDTTGAAIEGAVVGEGSPTDPLTAGTASDVREGAPGKVIDAGHIRTANAVVDLSDAASIAFDWVSGINFDVTLGGNRTLANPTNAIVGTWRTIRVTQDGTGSRTLAFGDGYVFPGGSAPTLTTTASASDRLFIFCSEAGVYEVYSSLDLS